MGDVTYNIRVDGRLYKVRGPKDMRPDEFDSAVEEILSAPKHNEYLRGKERSTAAIASLSKELGITPKRAREVGVPGAVKEVEGIKDYQQQLATIEKYSIPSRPTPYTSKIPIIKSKDVAEKELTGRGVSPRKLPGTISESINPHIPEVLAEGRGVLGGLQHFAVGALDSLPLLALSGGASAAGIPLHGAMTALGAAGTVASAADVEMARRDFPQYATTVGLNALTGGIPGTKFLGKGKGKGKSPPPFGPIIVEGEPVVRPGKPFSSEPIVVPQERKLLPPPPKAESKKSPILQNLEEGTGFQTAKGSAERQYFLGKPKESLLDVGTGGPGVKSSSYPIITKDGKQVAEAQVVKLGELASFQWLGDATSTDVSMPFGDLSNKIGRRELLGLLRDYLSDNPEITHVGGFRVAGGRYTKPQDVILPVEKLLKVEKGVEQEGKKSPILQNLEEELLDRKPLYEMSLDELDAEFKRVQKDDKDIEVRLFGEEGAKQYRAAQRTSNNSYASREAQEKADRIIEQMEAKLTPSQYNELFGIGDENVVTLEDVRDYTRALGGLDWESPESLGASLRWAVTDVGEKVNPAEMSRAERIAYATLRYAMEGANARGWDTRSISDVAYNSARARFDSEPYAGESDADFMTREFRKGPDAPIPQQQTNPNAGVASNIPSQKSNTINTGAGGGGGGQSSTPPSSTPPPTPPTVNIQTVGKPPIARMAGWGLDKIRNFFFENMSAWHRELPHAHDKIVRYASSADMANVDMHFNAPKVLAYLGEDDQKRLQTFLVADRIAAFLDGKASPSQAQKAAYQPGGGRLVDPITKKPITEQDLRDFFSRNDVKMAVDAHRRLIEPLLSENFQDAGFDARGIRGKFSDAFTPALALDEDGNPFNLATSKSGISGNKTAIGSVPGAKEFEGDAPDYISDYVEAITARLISGYRAAGRRQMVNQWVNDGILVDIAKEPHRYKFDLANPNDENPTHMVEWNGVWEPAENISFLFKQQAPNLPLPDKSWMPSRFANELIGLHEYKNQDALDRWLGHGMNAFIQAYLVGPGDNFAFGTAISSRLANKLPLDAKNPVLSKIADFVPVVKSMTRAYQTMIQRGNFPIDERKNAIKLMASLGRLPRDYGKPAPKGMGLIQEWVNGDDGILVRGGTLIYRYLESLPGGAAAHPDLARSLFSEYNSALPALRSQFQKALNSFGFGTFYQTGMRNRLSFFRQGLFKAAGGMVGATLLALGLFKATHPEHKDLWEEPSAKLGDIYVGENKDGRPRFFSLNFLHRTQGYSSFAVKSFLQALARDRVGWDKDKLLDTGSTLATDTVNAFLPPITSGPLAGAGFAAGGMIPQITGTDYFPHVGLMETQTPVLSKEKGVEVLSSLFPLSNALEAFNVEGERKAPDDNATLALNAALNALGVPGVRAGEQSGRVRALEMDRKAKRRGIYR